MDALKYKVYKSLDSTNEEAKRLLVKNHPRVWILALKQTDGKGRSGKRWLTEKNSFAASLLYYLDIAYSEMALRSYVAAVALYDCVVNLGVNEKRLTLKWPNDLLFDGRKVAGILLETVHDPHSFRKSLIVGFGVNLDLCPAPSQLDKSVNLPGTLKSSGCSIPDPEEFLNLLMPLYESWDQRLTEDGFDKLRAQYLNRTIPIGKKIAVNSANNSTTGFFSGIRGDGALEIKNASGTEFITAGDVYLIGE